MSRCFPFPPPGYERKHRPEDLDLLKEAKRKEKKHKKEKKEKEKEKEKKKDKEKEKDGSDEKHRDKKDRKGKHKDKKEKHRDKKKDKEDRGKDKDKSSISEESTVAGKLEEKVGGKLHPEVHSKEKSILLNEAKRSAPFQGQNGLKASQSGLPSQVNEESKFLQELDRRIRDDEKGGGSQLPERVAAVVKKDQEIVARAPVRNSSGLLEEEKVDNKNKRIDRKTEPQGLKSEFSGNTMVQNLMPLPKSKVEAIPKLVDEQNGMKLEYKEKYKETGGIKPGDRQKDWDKESSAKEKDKEKPKKKDDKAKIKTENKKSSHNPLKDDVRNDLGGLNVTKSANLLKETNSNAANEGNIGKRKDTCTNGFLHESEIRPSKMPRATPHQLTENGRKLEPSQTPTKSPHDRPGIPNSVRVDYKDVLMNGVIEVRKPSPSKPKSSAATVVGDQIAEASKIPQHDSHYFNKASKVPKLEDLIAEASRRPPHRDSKYLVEVLTVPKTVDWSENDDQEWLFSKKGPSSKPKVESAEVKEGVRVWSEAVHIESADVCALPYVIPY